MSSENEIVFSIKYPYGKTPYFALLMLLNAIFLILNIVLDMHIGLYLTLVIGIVVILLPLTIINMRMRHSFKIGDELWLDEKKIAVETVKKIIVYKQPFIVYIQRNHKSIFQKVVQIQFDKVDGEQALHSIQGWAKLKDVEVEVFF